MTDLETRRNRLREILAERPDLACLSKGTVESIASDLDEFLLQAVAVTMTIPVSQLGGVDQWWMVTIQADQRTVVTVADCGTPVEIFMKYRSTHPEAALINTLQLTEDQYCAWKSEGVGS